MVSSRIEEMKGHTSSELKRQGIRTSNFLVI